MWWHRIELNDGDWKDNKECCSDNEDDEDDEDDENDDNSPVLMSYKDLFKMATLGGATGKHFVTDLMVGLLC